MDEEVFPDPNMTVHRESRQKIDAPALGSHTDNSAASRPNSSNASTVLSVVAILIFVKENKSGARYTLTYLDRSAKGRTALFFAL